LEWRWNRVGGDGVDHHHRVHELTLKLSHHRR
jgi:hypothetical protein